MINLIKILIFGMSISMLFGCGGNKGSGWFRDRSNDYLEAKSYPLLEIPADTHSQKFSQEYEIPGT